MERLVVTKQKCWTNKQYSRRECLEISWKMNFNPDPSKQAQELLFSRKTSSKPYPSLNFNDNPFHQVPLQNPLGLFLDPKLSFDEHIQCILIKTRKIIGLIRKLQPVIPRQHC